MKDYALLERPAFGCHQDGWDSSFGCAHPVTDGPTDRLAVEEAQNNRQLRTPLSVST